MNFRSFLLRSILFFFLPFYLLAEKPKIVVLTIPKSGTHLIQSALAQISGRPVRAFSRWKANYINLQSNAIEIHHIWPQFDRIIDLLSAHTKIILLIRDPRDVLTSALYWTKLGHLPGSFGSFENFEAMSLDEQIHTLLTTPYLHTRRIQVSLPSMLQQTVRYMKRPEICVCRFEDLVGPLGGGSLEKQLTILHKMAHHIEQPLSESRAQRITEHLFGPNPVIPKGTFRQGQIGSWKTHFSSANEELFNELMGKECLEMGYPLGR